MLVAARAPFRRRNHHLGMTSACARFAKVHAPGLPTRPSRAHPAASPYRCILDRIAVVGVSPPGLLSTTGSRDHILTVLPHVSHAMTWVYSRRQFATGVASTVGVAGCPPAAMTKALTRASRPSGLNAAAVKSRELLASPQASV